MFKKGKLQFSNVLECLLMIFNNRNPKVAIGGGFLETLIHPDVQRHVCSGIVGLTFSGARVRADSIVIPQNITAPPEVEKLIVQVLFELFQSLFCLVFMYTNRYITHVS
jgi:hypothetical protein